MTNHITNKIDTSTDQCVTSFTSVLKYFGPFAFLILLSTAQAQDGTAKIATSDTELAIVDVHKLWKSILVTYPDKRTELIEYKLEGKGFDALYEMDRQMLDVFQRLYDERWQIESEHYDPVIGRALYIMKRTIQ